MFRVVVADHDESFRARLVGALSLEARLEVLGAAIDCPSAVELVRRTQPNLVLVALSMPHGGGLTLVRTIKRLVPDAVVVVRPGAAGLLTLHAALDAGAEGLVLEDGLDDDITSCIRFVSRAAVDALGVGGSVQALTSRPARRGRRSTIARRARCAVCREAPRRLRHRPAGHATSARDRLTPCRGLDSGRSRSRSRFS